MKHLARYLLFVLPMVLSYLGFLIVFFGGHLSFVQVTLSPVYLLIVLLVVFLFFFNLSIPDIKRLGIRDRQLFFFVSFFILVAIFWGQLWIGDSDLFFQQHGFQLLAGIFLIIGILAFIESKHAALDNRVVINFWMLQYAGVFMFSLFVSVFIALYSFGQFRSLPFSCDDIQSSQDEFVGLLFAPVRVGSDILTTARQRSIEFLETDVADALEGFVDVDLASDVTSLSFFKNIQNTFLLEAIQEKKEVDETVCEFMTTLITDKWSTPGLQYSVVFLVFLLLYPFLSVTFFLVSIVSYLLFSLLRRLGLRSVSRSLKEVEEIH